MNTDRVLALLVSAIFLWSGLSKLWDPVGFAAAVAGYRMTGPLATLAVAAVLPWIEVLCGAALWLARWRRAAVLCLLACCLAFAIAIGQAWARGLDIECGCFGGSERNAYLFWLLRDAVIFAALARLGWGQRRARPEQAEAWHGPWWRTGALVGCGALAGLGLDALRPSDGFWRDLLAGPPATTAIPVVTEGEAEGAIHEVDLSAIRRLIDSNGAIVVDARSRVFWRLGHLPGALSLPHDDFARALPDLLAKLEAAPKKPIVVYCEGGQCRDGESVVRRLVGRGVHDVRLFREGWEVWERAGLAMNRE